METVTEDHIIKTPEDGNDASRGFMLDVIEACQEGEHGYVRAVALGTGWHAAGGDLVGLAREIARVGHELEDRVPQRQELRVALDEAAARAFDAFAAARRGRRDRWLSHFSHEMRNGLNTLVNAHWILKSATEGKKTERVLEMAERAIRKLEASIKELRELEEKTRTPAPGRPDP